MNVTFATGSAECVYLISAKIAYPIRTFAVFCGFGDALTMISFMIERSIAFFACGTYEKKSSRKLAFCLIIFEVFFLKYIKI